MKNRSNDVVEGVIKELKGKFNYKMVYDLSRKLLYRGLNTKSRVWRNTRGMSFFLDFMESLS